MQRLMIFLFLGFLTACSFAPAQATQPSQAVSDAATVEAIPPTPTEAAKATIKGLGGVLEGQGMPSPSKVWQPPTLEQAKVVGEGRPLPENIADFETVVRDGFSAAGISLKEVDLVSHGSGNSFHLAAVPRNAKGEILWGFVKTSPDEFGFTESPVLVQYDPSSGYHMQTEGLEYRAIPNSQDAVVAWGGSDGTLPILVKEPVKLADGSEVYALYWDRTVSQDVDNVGEWQFIPELGYGRYGVINGQVYKVDQGELVPLEVKVSMIEAVGNGWLKGLDEQGKVVFAVDPYDDYHLITNGFEVRENGTVWEWRDGDMVMLDKPAEIMAILEGEPESNTDRRARVVLEGMTMTLVDGVPKLQIPWRGDMLTLSEYKEGRWQTADFFISANQDQIAKFQEQLKKMPKDLISEVRDENDYDITLRTVVGVGIKEGELYALATYGDGSSWLVVKPDNLGILERTWVDSSHEQTYNESIFFGPISKISLGEAVRLVWLCSDYNREEFVSQLSVYGPKTAFANFEGFKQKVASFEMSEAEAGKAISKWQVGEWWRNFVAFDGLTQGELYVYDRYLPDE